MTQQQVNRRAIITSNSKGRILSTLRSLALAKTTKARAMHCCGFCACPINVGQDTKKASKEYFHVDCFLAVNLEFNKR